MTRQKTIDCHTHAYPEEVVANPREWAVAQGEKHWADLVAPEGRPSIQGWSHLDQMLGAMDAAGVDQAVLLGWYWENESTCRWHNEVMAEWMHSAPTRLIAFAAVYPNENVIEQLEAAKKFGFSGVGELHMGVQGFSASCPYWQAMAKWCAANRWPVNFHVTEAAGHDHPGSVPTPLQEFVRIAEGEPSLRMILAHWGGGLPFFEQNPKLQKILRNVYYDTAASPLLYEMSIFKQMVELVGINKLLFGSDYPLRIYPKSQKTPDMHRFIESISSKSGLSDSDMESLLGGNFSHLLNAPAT